MTSFDLVTLDVASPDAAADFWKAVLGLVESEREDGDRWIVLSDVDGVRRIGLQRGIPRPGGVHLDLACSPDEFDAECRRIVELGAEMIGDPRHEPYGSIVNLRDPEGYVFDLCAYV